MRDSATGPARTPEHAAEPVLSNVEELVDRAFQDANWAALQYLWTKFLSDAEFTEHPRLARSFAELPESVRRDYPLLSMAAADAYASALPPDARGPEVARIVARDAMTLHSRWAGHSDTDAAVLAGTLWMVTQRYQPTDALEALDAAWHTRNELVEFLARRREEQRPANIAVWSFFRAASAQLALIRADLAEAAADAEFAVVAGDDSEAVDLARGTRALALALAGVDAGEALRGPAPVWRRGIVPGKGTRDEAAASWSLAQGLVRVRLLDRDGVAEALADTTPRARGSAVWTGRAWLAATATGLWGDPREALAVLDTDIAENSLTSIEQRQTLGMVALGRARHQLLLRLGGIVAATDAVAAIPAPWHWAPAALHLLWTGDTDGAASAAESALYDPLTPRTDRLRMALIRAAAAVRRHSGEVGDRLALDALTKCIRAGNLLPVTELPRGLRQEVVGAAQALASTELAELVARLAQLAPSEEVGPAAALTRREQVLLPLLATSATAAEIAAQLHVSVTTVRSQIATLRSKFGARSRAELVRRARDAGLLV